MNSLYVYVFQEDRKSSKSPVKIGVSKNIDKRLAGVQNGNPRNIVLRAKFGPMSRVEAFDLEAHFHRCLSAYRIRGEWFSGKALSKILNETESLSRNKSPRL